MTSLTLPSKSVSVVFGKNPWPGFVITTSVTPREVFPSGSVTSPMTGKPPAP